MSRAKQKGTVGENEIVALLEDHGIPDVHRNSASAESWDIRIGAMPMPIEVKFRQKWDLMAWIRKIRAVATPNLKYGHQEWAIFAIHGKRNTTAGREVGAVMVVDADFGAALLAHWVRES